MRLSRFFFTLFASALLLLSACSPNEAPKAATASKAELSVDVIAAQAKGFAAGAMMSATTVYVFFDTQCPHCGHLWNASQPLHRKVKFVWIPIGMINASSKSQGAALLTSANPAALMTEHEASLLAGKGGIAAPAGAPSEIEDAIKANTALFNNYGAGSVPFLVVKNQRTGQTISKEGALDTAVLADFIGIDNAP
jgi:thiol:disulfide interchange protein DsbG